MSRAIAIACGALLLAGCCTGPSYMALAYNPRLQLEQRQTFAVVAPVLSDATVWAYGSPGQRIAVREEAYRPDPTRGAQRSVGAPSDAPADIADVLERATRSLTELGYRAVAADGREEFVLALALTWRDDGSLARVAVHVGADLDGRFDPYAISLAAVLSETGACTVTAAELTEDLVSFFPRYGDAP